MSLARAQKIADAVLYEGYLLYPYRASSRKNQMRWQFGVLAPRQWSEAGGCEHWWMQTECLIHASERFELIGKVRFLHIQHRLVEEIADSTSVTFRPVQSIEAEGGLWTSWDEATERAVEFELAWPPADQRTVSFEFPEERETEPIVAPSGRRPGRFVRERRAVAGIIRMSSEPVSTDPLIKVRVRIENVTPWSEIGAPRESAIQSSLVGVHTLLEAKGGQFVSLLDPPAWARSHAETCANQRTWPVLVGEGDERNVMLSSPIILYDYPQIAPESPGDLYDSTEIDEILSLRTMTLTDEEKREARATDPRAAAIIDRVDDMPQEIFERLHGAIRYLRGATSKEPASEEKPPWWDPGADASVSPETDSIEIDGAAVAKGSRVRLHPGARRADAQDMFVAGRIARVEGVYFDVENSSYLAVTLEDDPAADLRQSHGRYLYFYPDEVEPLEEMK